MQPQRAGPPTNTVAFPEGEAMGAVLCAVELTGCLHITPGFWQAPPAAQNNSRGGGRQNREED